MGVEQRSIVADRCVSHLCDGDEQSEDAVSNDFQTQWPPPPDSPWAPKEPTQSKGPWATFRAWPLAVQVIVWIVLAFFGLGAIGAATGAGDKKPTRLASDAHSAAPDREEVVSPTEPPSTTTAPTTPVVTPTTVYVPPTTVYVPPTTRYVPPTTRYVTPAVRRTSPAPSPSAASPSAPAASGQCDPNYSGACVPANVSDVDCGGGSGNGPYYVWEKNFRVVGTDHYGLDADGDGIACES